MLARPAVWLCGCAIVLLAGTACAPTTASPSVPTVAAATATTSIAAKPTAAAANSPAPAAAASPTAVTATGPAAGAAAKPSASPAVAAANPAASPSIVVAVAVASPSPVARPTLMAAPQPAAAGTFGFGRAASAADISRINIDVRPDGSGLPPGSGSAAQGGSIFAQKCAACHGPNGEGTAAAPKLVDPTPYQVGVTPATVGNYWPYSTTVWDYINRAMPFDKPGSLSPDEVYALTAFLLADNKIIGEADVMDSQSLPKVQMPNAAGFSSPDPRPDAP